MIETETVLSAVLDADVFREVSQEDVKKILSHPKVKQTALSKGQYIYHHGDMSDKFWIILSGEIVAQTSSLRHPFHPLNYLPGDITGIRGYVDPGKPRPVSMVADSNSEVIEIPTEVVRAMEATVWGTIMNNMARIILDRLLECRNLSDH